MLARRAEQLLQGVVGPRQLGNLITVEQSGQVTVTDLKEVFDGRLQLAGPIRPTGQGRQMGRVVSPHRLARLSLGVAQNLGGLMDHIKPLFDRRPQLGRLA
jgi:hypothetical protein